MGKSIPPLFLVITEITRIGSFHFETKKYSGLEIISDDPFFAVGCSSDPSKDFTVNIPVRVDRVSRTQIMKLKFDELTDTVDSITVDFPGGGIVIRVAMGSSLPSSDALIKLPDLLIIGHRGSGANDIEGRYLENTLPSYRAAINDGANAVEVDVQMSGDSIPVVNHDREVENVQNDQCADGFVRVRDITAQTFKKSGLCTAFATKRPSLENVLREVPRKAILDIELKFFPLYTLPAVTRAMFVDSVLQDIDNFGEGRDLFFCTFDVTIAALLALQQKKYPCFILAKLLPDEEILDLIKRVNGLVLLCKRVGISGIILEADCITLSHELAQCVTRAGLRVMSWGSENMEKQYVAEQLRIGVSGFVTDNVNMTKEFVAKALDRDIQNVY